MLILLVDAHPETAVLPNLYVPDERDPPEADKSTLRFDRLIPPMTMAGLGILHSTLGQSRRIFVVNPAFSGTLSPPAWKPYGLEAGPEA